MALDVRTMYIAVAAVCFINAATSSIVLGGRFRRGDGTFLWTLGWAFQAGAWTLVALRGIVWDFFSIVVYITLLSAAFSLFYTAVREHRGRPYSWTLLFLPPSVAFVFSWYFSAIADSVVHRSFFIAILLMVQTGTLAWALFRKTPGSERRSSLLTGFAFLMACVLFSGRLMEVLVLPHSRLSVLGPLLVSGVFFMVGLGVVLLANTGFLLMTRQKAEARLREKEEHYRSLFDGMLNGYAFCRMFFDGDKPADFVYLEVNNAFENLTGLRNVTGKRVSEVIPGIRQSNPKVFEIYGRVTRFGIPERFEAYIEGLGAWFAVSVYSPQKEHFVAVFDVITDRKRAEEALRESERQYRLAIECSSDGVAIAQNDRYVMFNQRYPEMFGYSAEEIADVPIGNIVHPHDYDRVHEYVLKEREGEPVPPHYEFKGIKKNGETIYVEASTSIVSYNGQPAGIGYFRDVTEQRRAREALRLSEQRMALHVEQTPLGVVEWDAELKVREWNPAAERIFGYTREEAIGRRYEFIVPETARQDVDAVVRASVDRQEGQRSRNRNVTKNGTVITCEWFNTPLIDHEGKTLGIAALVEDVTEHEKAEAALAAAEQKYRIVADNTYDWEFWRSPEGRFVYVSPACEAISGYSPAAFEADPHLMERITHPEDRVALQTHLHTVMAEPHPERLTFRVIRPDGEIRWVEHACRPVWSKEGEYLGVRGSNRDITDRMRLEEQLRQVQKLEAIGTLAGGVAHDFNNLLTVIMGFSNLIQAEIGPTDRVRPYVDQILASSEKAAELTQRLLAFSRKQRITLEPHSVNEIVRSTAKLLKRLLPEDIKLKLELTREDVTAQTDVGQIDQVLMNLATNARDAMPRGGSLIIKTEVSTLDEEFHDVDGFAAPGRYVCLSISDSGAGMDEATVERIFEPFFTTKAVGKGTGLGLASVYGTVKQHRGYITVASKPYQGTTFHIYLPLVDAGRREAAAPIDELRRGTETVLVAEDDPDVRRMLTIILESNGYTVIQAIDGEDAVRVYNENREKIGIALLDVVMPGKNGREVLDEMTRINPQVRAVFVSGYTGDVVIDKGVRSDSVDFVQKPVSVAVLLKKVREVLDR